MKALVLATLLALGALFWWGVFTHTLLAFTIYGGCSIALMIAAVVYERRAERRRKRDWPTAKLVN